MITINTLEHIEDDAEALRSLVRLVLPGGTIMFWVPATRNSMATSTAR